jgi:hypothetical protein
MDEGRPIAYLVLERGVPIYAAGGEQIGTVDHVVAAFDEDIFHGIVMRTDSAHLFVPADEVSELHERGVDLRIDVTAAAALYPPPADAPAFQANQPGVKPTPWNHLVNLFGGPGPRSRDWRRD